MIDLYHSDEGSFALMLPACDSWTLVDLRLIVPYEAPHGRRVNGIDAYFTHGVEARRFVYELCVSMPKSTAKQPRKSPEEQAAKHSLRVEQVGPIDGERFVRFVWKVAGRPAIDPEVGKRERPLVLVVDNYAAHTRARAKA